MLQTRGGEIHRHYGDSSKGQVVIATEKYLAVSCHLPNNLSDPSQVATLKKDRRFDLF